jgi:hypothetical protein
MMDRRQFYGQAAKEWDDAQAQKAANEIALERRAMPRLVAQGLADRLRFTPETPIDELRHLVRALKQLEPGNDLDEALSMIRDGLQAEATRVDTATAELQAKIASLQNQLVGRPTLDAPHKMTHEEFLALDPAERAKTDYYREHYRGIDDAQ